MTKYANTFIVALVLLGIGVTLVRHSIPLPDTVHTHLEPGDVRGMALEVKGKLYTLNFKQQEAAVRALNKSVSITDKPKQYPYPYSSLIIYRFDKPDLVIQPINYQEPKLPNPPLKERHERNIVFSCPEWDANRYFVELSGGELYNVLGQAFDAD
ncbi:MAG: hypothetical protein KDK65_05535 [Chlamydiia bacterium]|nr:hypothetical protein [Chlamydiia bacterium]